MGLLIFHFPRVDAKAVIDPEEKRTPQSVLFDIATTRINSRDHNKMDVLNLLFEPIAKDLPDELKLAWLLQLSGDKEKFCSLLNTLEPEWVSHLFFLQYFFLVCSGEQNTCAKVRPI